MRRLTPAEARQAQIEEEMAREWLADAEADKAHELAEAIAADLTAAEIRDKRTVDAWFDRALGEGRR